jgi:hypothetical protein
MVDDFTGSKGLQRAVAFGREEEEEEEEEKKKKKKKKKKANIIRMISYIRV